MLYQILFEDRTIFEGSNTYFDKKWSEMPDKNIAQIGFRLPDGNWLTLKGYEAYNHFIEATQDIYGSNKFILRYQYIMGKRGDKVHSYRITLFQDKDEKYHLGDITRREYKFGEEYSGKPTAGWKSGIKYEEQING
jgi:hypothetical protein